MYNIETLAKLSGLTRRTIRFYVQRGVLDPPEGAGRGSFYTQEHLKRIKRIKSLAGQGVPLMHMRKVLDGDMPLADARPEEPDTLDTSVWSRCIVDPDLELYFRMGTLNLEQLQKIRAFIANLKQGETNA